MNYNPWQLIFNHFSTKKTPLLKRLNNQPFLQRRYPNISEIYFITMVLQQDRSGLRPFRPTGTGFVLQFDVVMDQNTVLPFLPPSNFAAWKIIS